ncbi:hypothetical protein HPB47_020025 [Ixodes persulcatus]|uniref:Uncharacterized protein n=1 Tax=Ixodes persulcatus TaxID=34615 RepID=A0AC60QHH2_IXOPE|nr:hypothetical protein HPB47_020025 [Ixodes persulcatus]
MGRTSCNAPGPQATRSPDRLNRKAARWRLRSKLLNPVSPGANSPTHQHSDGEPETACTPSERHDGRKIRFWVFIISEFCLKRFGGSTGGPTEVTSQLGAFSHGRLVVSASSLAKPDSFTHKCRHG